MIAPCTVTLEIVDNADHVAPGGDLPVRVHVECTKAVKIKGIPVTRFWRTHGKGNVAQGDKRVVDLYEGELEAGYHSFDAVIPFPDGPFSYHGENINIDWYIEARLDIAFKLDPKDEKSVLLVSTEAPRPYVEPETWAPQPIKMSGSMGSCLIPAVLMAVVGGVVIATGHGYVGAAIAAVAAVFVVKSMMHRAAAKALGHVALDVHPGTIRPGEELHAWLELKPETSLELESIELSLFGKEEAVSGVGTDTTTYTCHPVEEKRVIATSLTLDGTRRFEEEATYALPVTAPPTLEASDNNISYYLELTLHPAGKPKMKGTLPIVVG